MRIGNKLGALGLTVALLTAGCGGNSGGPSTGSGVSATGQNSKQLAQQRTKAEANHKIPACTSMPKEMVSKIVGQALVQSDAENLGSDEPGICHYRTAAQDETDIPAFSVQRSEYLYENWFHYEQLPHATALTLEEAKALGGDAAVKIDETITSADMGGVTLEDGPVHMVTYVVRPKPYTGMEVEASMFDAGSGIDDAALRALVKAAVEKL